MAKSTEAGSVPVANLLRFQRRHGQPPKPSDERSDAERDRDRILFSSAFRRLAGVTQVIAPTEMQPIHNRLTHSLKVAQIGRGLAVRILTDEKAKPRINEVGGLDPTVVEAAGLAHDLGHPPFGHIAEHELNALVTHGLTVPVRTDADARERECQTSCSSDGFEGNAQSFRIVTKISARYIDTEGLDLCCATLCALLKYPWTRIGEDEDSGPRNRKKWGAYTSEKPDLDWARRVAPQGSHLRSLEAALMDWADDIAYAVHDLEDFYRAGLIPLDQLALDGAERVKFLKDESERQEREERQPASFSELEAAFRTPMEMAKDFKEPYTGSRVQRALLRQFTSKLINKYMDALSFSGAGWGEEAVTIDPVSKLEVETLKRLTWYYVIESQSLASQRFGQRSVIRALFEILASAAYSSDRREWRIFPTFFRDQLCEDDLDKPRLVADVIASMSEVEAIEMYQRFTGSSLGSALMRPAL